MDSQRTTGNQTLTSKNAHGSDPSLVSTYVRGGSGDVSVSLHSLGSLTWRFLVDNGPSRPLGRQWPVSHSPPSRRGLPLRRLDPPSPLQPTPQSRVSWVRKGKPVPFLRFPSRVGRSLGVSDGSMGTSAGRRGRRDWTPHLGRSMLETRPERWSSARKEAREPP